VGFEHCQIHHVTAWERGGSTNLANLLPLCSRHHHLVHEGGWQLTLQPDRTITLTRPDGTVHHNGSTVTRAPTGVSRHPEPQTLRIEVAEEASAHISARARAPAA
jgi:hypothetical protein